MRSLLMMTLLVYTIALTHTTRAQERDGNAAPKQPVKPITLPSAEPQVNDVDVMNVGSLHPIAVARSSDKKALPALKRQFNISELVTGYSAHWQYIYQLP